jgi:hypothetical protein
VGWAANTFAVQDIIRNGSTSGIFRVNDANQVTIASNIYTGNCSLNIKTYSAVGATMTADWVLVRKYNASEPSVSALGLEEPSTVIFQLRSADDLAGLSAAAWYGPAGAGDYYTTSGTSINPVHNGKRYIQYRAFISDAASRLNDVTLEIDSTQTLTSSPYDIGDVTAVLSEQIERSESIADLP